MMYSLSEAAKAIGKSKSTLSAAIRNGKLPASKDDRGRYLIDPADLDRLYSSNGQGDDQSNSERPTEHPNAAQVDQPADGSNAAADRSVEAGATGDLPNTERPIEHPNAAQVDRPADGPNDASDRSVEAVQVAATGDLPNDERPIERPNDAQVDRQVDEPNAVADRSVETVQAGATGDQPNGDRPTEHPNDAQAVQAGATGDQLNGDRPIERLNDLQAERSADGPNATTDRSEGSAAEAIIRMQQEQIDRLDKERERERAQFAAQIEKVEAAGQTARRESHIVYPMAGVAPQSAPASVPDDLVRKQDLQEMRSDIAAMQAETQEKIEKARSDLAHLVGQVKANLTARPSLPVRAGLILLQGWCILCGLYMAGFLYVIGADEALRVGRVIARNLHGDILALWPF